MRLNYTSGRKYMYAPKVHKCYFECGRDLPYKPYRRASDSACDVCLEQLVGEVRILKSEYKVYLHVTERMNFSAFSQLTSRQVASYLRRRLYSTWLWPQQT